MNRGGWYAVGAYVAWGLLPAYWKNLRHLPATEILAHRIVWSCAALAAAVLFLRQMPAVRSAVRAPRILGIYCVAAALIGGNWLLYVWAVNAGYLVETSLGYFINPLASLLLGVVFLGERPRPWQWLPVGLAAVGVGYLTWSHGSVPWLALTLAFTFALYALAKKAAPLASVPGLALETMLLVGPALFYLLRLEGTGQGAFGHTDFRTGLFLAGAGVATTTPLLLFAAAARRMPLFVMGLYQYVSPTLQLLLGVAVYDEPFTRAQAVGFGIVWAALALFVAEGFLARRPAPPPPLPAEAAG